MIKDWHGYSLGAICADTPGLQIVKRDGDTYAITQGRISNVHPKVTACQTGDLSTRIEHEAGVYPIRWDLDPLEVAALIRSTI